MYHVMSRGDQRDDIFLDDVDRHDFIKTLAEACQKTGWQVERRRLEEVNPEELEKLRGGWCLGSEAFRKEQLERMEGKLGEHQAGELRRQTAEAKAERLVGEELARLNWRAEELVRRRKNDPDKLAIGVRLRCETTLSVKAVAARVHLGAFNSANANLHRAMQAAKRSSGGQETLRR